ncbi:MAG TPA: fimbria/pilus periplasmic chaperone [Novosphingobium sp.]|nr:fimbria/pilus periplasmic chaperone [Novosphingobium sp.]
MDARRASGLTAILLGFLALLGSAVAVPAWAGSLSVMPVRVDVAAGRRFCSVTLGNDTDRPMTVQVRAFAWTRDENGADILGPDGGLVVNPSIATIAPGTTRLVRCSLPAGDPAAQAEQQWRLIVDQLPDPDFSEPGTVQTLLRISLPVFRAGDKAAPRLSATVSQGTLRLSNAGTRHVKALALTLRGVGGDAVTIDRAFYLLAGGAQNIPIERFPRGGIVSVHVRAEEGEFEAALSPVN